MNSRIRLVPRDGTPAAPLEVDPRPAALGRWQLTRAGVVNSWQWADEQFLALGGWMALVGPNGSGKSLTGVMLCPSPFDGDVSQKALSVQGHAAGTLTDRHTNQKRGGPPKTGVWWQELGRTDPADGDTPPQTRWCTIGLWLRSSGKGASVERAWFIAPGRVGLDLRVAVGGSAIGIEELAQQLAACNGRLFTSVDDLARAAGRHLAGVQPESGYAGAVRAAIFHPLGGDEFTALCSVLRALRGIRVGDRVSPDLIHSTLTRALPALDAQRTQRLAAALAKSKELEDQREKARREHEALTEIATAYRRYAGAVAAHIAAQLLSADTETGTLAGQLAALEVTRQRLNDTRGAAQDAAEALAIDLSDLEQSIGVLERRTQGHPGAALADVEQAAVELERIAAEQRSEAEQARQAADDADNEYAVHHEQTDKATAHLRQVQSALLLAAEALGATAHCRPAQQAAATLTDADRTATVLDTSGLDQALEPLRAWAKRRTTVLTAIGNAVAVLRRNQAERDRATGARDSAQEAAALQQDAADTAADAVAAAEAELAEKLAAYADELRQLQPPPVDVYNDGIDLSALQEWVRSAFAAAETLWDAPGKAATARSAAEAARMAHSKPT